MIAYRVYIIAVHTVHVPGVGTPIEAPGMSPRSVVVETNIVMRSYAEALSMLTQESDPDASGGVRDFIVSASITIEPEGR